MLHVTLALRVVLCSKVDVSVALVHGVHCSLLVVYDIRVRAGWHILHVYCPAHQQNTH